MPNFDSWEMAISHSGVLGMKWGVRRYQNKDGTLTALGKRRYGTAENFERVQSMKKNPRYMTDAELQRNTARLAAEKQYRDLQSSQNRGSFLNKAVDFYQKQQNIKNEKEKREVEKLKANSQMLQEKYKADAARYEAKKAKKEQAAKVIEAKNKQRSLTIRGGLSKRLHDKIAGIKNDPRKVRDLKKTLEIKSLEKKIKDIDEFGSLTLEEVEERAIAKANRRRRH